MSQAAEHAPERARYGRSVGGVALIVGTASIAAELTVRRTRAAALALVLLATGAAAWPIALTWMGVLQLTGADSPLSAWRGAVLPSAIVAAVSLVVSVAGLVARGRAASTLLFIGAGGMCVAAVVQPGLGIGFPAAAGMLVAAGWRTADAALA